jgi:hypothetical protein
MDFLEPASPVVRGNSHPVELVWDERDPFDRELFEILILAP